jgi:S1-C subfamily serine protease
VRIGRYRLAVGGDIITAIDGQPINDLQALTVYLETERAVGDTVQLSVIRDGEERLISLTLAAQPRE